MKPLYLVVLCFAAALWLGIGCDDQSNDIPQSVLDQQARQAAIEKTLPKIPTTQELVTGPRTVMPLGPLPMTMRVPTSWKVEVTSGASLLRGHTPSGEITIQLTSRPSLKKPEFDALIKAAKKEQAEKPQSILKADVRPLGNVQVYERQAVGDPAPYTVYDSNLKEHTTTEQLFKWTISVLAPHGEGLQRYELNFVGLTKSQYDQDKEFLQGMLDTLHYGLTGASTGSPPPTTLP
ncbi:MAG: hypothetical protein QOF78_527 [Phycisphaerales bacterium]|jgi:hypothetical protein|nr:hypothetical protein [Phycisphaerales bacterium]